MLVQQILKSKGGDGAVISVKPSAQVSDAAKLLSDNRIGTVIVSNDGQSLDGILSERDIVRELGKSGAGCLSKPVSTLMTAEIVTCKPTDTADAILEMMTKGRFRHIPVMEDDKMVGLVSIGDVVKARLSELSMEKDALQDMIMGH